MIAPAPSHSLRWIAHVDLDAFFASCEQRDHPEYQGKPVIVGALPGNRGVVAACSYEARVFGIHSAMPIAEAHRRCPDAIYLRPDISKYKRYSKQVFDLFNDITPFFEKASIDEAYLDISGLENIFGSPAAIGTAIRKRIYQATQLTASVGIGPNRLIAKLGSEANKPDGLTIVKPDEVLDFLAPMPIGNLRGLGKQTQKIFRSLNINTVGELRATPIEALNRHLGEKAALSFKRQAQGIASAEIVTDRQRKSISKETTFSSDIIDRKQLKDVLRKLSAQVAQTARREGLAGTVVTLKIRFKGFETYTRQKTLASPTNDERTLVVNAHELLSNSGLPDKPVRLVGIGMSHWDDGMTAQTDLFAQPEQQKQDKKILDAIDTVAEKFGKPMLGIGVVRTRKDKP